MSNLLFIFFTACHRLVRGLANRALPHSRVRPREFSNALLKRYAALFRGDVINVSGWRDEDGEGGRYQTYFMHANSYAVSNVGGQGKGFGSAGSAYREIEVDLEKEIPSHMLGAFDVVFNHTTLEHVYEFKKAFAALCALSRDAVILVVPVLQQIHHTDDFGDYWRPTTMAVVRLFRENGFTPVVIQCNDQPFAPVYCFAIAVKDPAAHSDITPDVCLEMGAHNYGSSLDDKAARRLAGL